MDKELGLNMEGIVKRFSGVKVLDGVCLSVRKGEVHALVGENGAGKSTLMKILAGIYGKDEGTISIDGETVSIHNPGDSRNLGIAFVHQHPNLVSLFDVGRNIFLGREPLNALGQIDWNRLYDQTEKLLKNLDVNFSAKKLVQDLTVAQRQEVEIIKALSLNPQYIVFDEPTAPLTFREVDRLYEIIRSLKQKGVTSIYISHRLDEIFTIADRITVLRNGRTIRTKEVAQCKVDEIVQMMIGTELNIHSVSESHKTDEPILTITDLQTSELNSPVNLTIHKGEVVGLFGLVGAGRTEFAHAVFGVDQAIKGKIFYDKSEISPITPRNVIKAGIGFVPEDRQRQGLILEMPIENNMTLASLKRFTIGGFIKHKFKNKTVQGLVQELAIKIHSIFDPVNSLSGGNQQKVVLAKWLCRGSQVFLLDEPTVGVDVGAKGEIYKLIAELTRKGSAVIFITSEPEEILRVSDRILVMYRKKIVSEFDAKEATVEKLYSTAMGVV